MAVKFSRSRGRLGAVRRETLWAPIPFTIMTITGGGVALVATASASEDALRPYTVVRTHLHASLSSDQLIATETQVVAVGLAVVSDQASAIGVSAVPTPVTDLASDAWYLHQWIMNEMFFITGVGFEAGMNKEADWDSKAMRRIEDGFDNILVVEAPAGLDGLNISLAGRQLLKLH